MTVVTRFAPSPTGLLHCGNYRTAVFAYLYAKKMGGKFIVRIEDTDKQRSKKEYEDNILESLRWLDLPWDDLYRQSERNDIHKKYLKQLVESGHAYVSDERGKEGAERDEVIRFKNPNIEVTFVDTIRGSVTMNTSDLGDFVIAKSLDEPLFHLAVVVDDHDMGVTHVIRGEDHISNTPRQILIQRAIGAIVPTYAHLPLVLASDRSKLSKRKGAQPVSYYRDRGFLPVAVLNYLTLLGWNPGTEQELFTRDELASVFTLERVQKHGAIFDDEKLLWFNHQHLAKLSDSAFREQALASLPHHIQTLPGWSSERFDRLIPNLRERIKTFGEISTLAEAGELSYLFDSPQVDSTKISWKDTSSEITRQHLTYALETLKNAQNWSPEGLKALLWDYATLKGRGEVLWPIRFSLSGKDRSPDPFTLGYILGKEETLLRITAALGTLG